MLTYILKDGEAVLEPDPLEWSRWLQANNDIRRVALTLVGGTKVSTVFLAVDQEFGLSNSPVLWETLVFGGPLDGEMERYTSLDDALHGHEVLVARVEAAQRP